MMEVPLRRDSFALVISFESRQGVAEAGSVHELPHRTSRIYGANFRSVPLNFSLEQGSREYAYNGGAP
jgi:hypothetical protein